MIWRQKPFRMPVQWVNRPDQNFRGFSGTIASGAVRPGDQIKVLPSAKTAIVERVVTYDGDLADGRRRPVAHHHAQRLKSTSAAAM